ncbi:MAG: hypothetical protein H0X40_14315 [Chthoniobacterales bacterium]|nr:hypothetical protein [Chthoniobacterales bacterium]
MKPLPLSISPSPTRHHDRAERLSTRSFPQTDYHFHAPAEDVAAWRAQHATAGRAELRAFRRMSSDYLDEKNHHGYLVEMIAFAIVAGLAAWSLASLVVTLAQTASG